MRSRLVLLMLPLLLAAAPLVQAQRGGGRPIDPAMVEADRQVMGEIRHNSKVMENVEYLLDVIGPRLTGSENLKRASDWTLERFREYGLSNTHLEEWKSGTAWTRGTAEARIIGPTARPLT